MVVSSANSSPLAVKLQSKYQIIKNHQVGHLYNEANLMAAMDHPFVCKLKGLAQDRKMVYLYLEYVDGGDLMNILNKFHKLDADYAKFYIS
jgi:serine/threonine protein kinase